MKEKQRRHKKMSVLDGWKVQVSEGMWSAEDTVGCVSEHRRGVVTPVYILCMGKSLIQVL